jgi:O-methyltransferase
MRMGLIVTSTYLYHKFTGYMMDNLPVSFKLIFEYIYEILNLKVMLFLFNSKIDICLLDKIKLINRFINISRHIESPHTMDEILSFVESVLFIPSNVDGPIVEAGCYKGSSSAKFSIVAKMVNRQLIIYDSFEGIPENNEPHTYSIYGETVGFRKGDYSGNLDEVKSNICKYGEIDACKFVKGWFDNTMPALTGPIVAAYIDVDLASSTQTCIKYIYPLIVNGGYLYSQDGHLPLVIDVFNNDEFWEREVGCKKPLIHGLGTNKIIKIQK